MGSKFKELAHRITIDKIYQHLIFKGFVAKERFMVPTKGPGIPWCL